MPEAEQQEVVQPEVAVEEPTVVSEADEPEQEPEQKPEKPPKTFTEEELNRKIQKRLERAQRSFERKMNEALEAERQRYAQQQVPRETSQQSPKIDQFDNFDDYVAAKAEWVANQALEKRLAEQRQADELRRQQERNVHVEQGWTNRVNQIRGQFDDFDDVIESSGVEVSQAMSAAIMESDLGPQVAYYLAKHPDEAEKIASMGPSAAFRAIGRIESKIEGENLAKKQSSAPKPVSPVGAKSGTASKDPDKMTTDEWLKWRNAQLKAARG